MLKNQRFAYEQTLCGYKLVEPVGSDHTMDASAAAEGTARDEGGEGVEVLISWVPKRLRPSV